VKTESVRQASAKRYCYHVKAFSALYYALLLCVGFCSAQTKEAPKLNGVSFELGKTGLIYNLNFDHKLVSSNYGFRVNVGSNFDQYLNIITLGVGGYYLFGKIKNYLELGLDLQYLVADKVSDDQMSFASVFVYPDYSIRTIYPSINLGYRRYGKRTLFRIGLSPGFINGEFIPGGYLSFGFLF
jgi:hypothetical protein